MTSVPGVTVTGTPGSSQGSGAVPDSSKPTVPSGPSGPPTSIGQMSSPPSPSSSSSPPEQPLTPQALNSPPQMTRDYYGNPVQPGQKYVTGVQTIQGPKGNGSYQILTYSTGQVGPGGSVGPITKDQAQAQAEQANIKALGFTPGAEFPSTAEVNAKIQALGINYESQTGNLVNGVITTGGGSPRDLYVQTLLSEVAQGYKGQGFTTEESYLSNRLSQVGLAYNPQSKTITDPLLIGIISQQRENQTKGGYAGISFGSGETSGIVGPSTALSLKLGSSLGQEATGYITRFQQSDLTPDLIKQGVKAGDIKLQYSSDQVKALTQPITEYGNIPNFFDKNNTGTSATPNPALAIIQVPGGPITPEAKALGSSLGQVALGQLVRNSPFESSTLSSEATRALAYNPTTAIYGNKPELQTPRSINPTNYTLNFTENLNIGEKLSGGHTSTIPINSPLLARQLVEQANNNIAVQNAVSKLSLQSDISKFVNAESAKGVKQISIYDLTTGSNIGKVQANKSGIDVINEIAQQRQVYLKDYVDPFVKAQQLKQSNESRNEIVSYIGEAQTLGLKLNLIDKSGKLISTVPSESGYHSLVGAEKGGNVILISKAAPQTPQEIQNYLTRQSSLMLSNNKNNTEDQNAIDLIRGGVSGVYNILFGIQTLIISAPENTHAILEKGNPEFYGNNDIITTISNFFKPSPFVANYTNKVAQPESVTQDILNLQVPKESTNYLIGEGLIEGGLVVQQLKEAGTYASQLIGKAGPVVKGLVARTFDTSNLITLPKANAETTPSGTTRATGTFKNLNMMRTPVPKDVFGFDTTEITRLSETPKIPTNPLLEDLSKETQVRNTAIQNKLLEPSTPKPINPNQKPISVDPFYRPSKTVSASDLQGVTPPEDLTGGTAPIKKPVAPSNPFDATTANQVPGVTITGQPGSTTGGVGIPDVFSSKTVNEYIDSLQIPRSSIVEQTKIKSENEIFNFEGKRLETNFGSVSSKDPLGLLRKETLKNVLPKELELPPSKYAGLKPKSPKGQGRPESEAFSLLGTNPADLNLITPRTFDKTIEALNIPRAEVVGAYGNEPEDLANLYNGFNPEKETLKNIKLDPFYRNTVPMKSLGATNKISKNVARVDVESLLNIERVKPDLSDFMNIGKESKFKEEIIELGKGEGLLKFNSQEISLGKGSGDLARGEFKKIVNIPPNAYGSLFPRGSSPAEEVRALRLSGVKETSPLIFDNEHVIHSYEKYFESGKEFEFIRLKGKTDMELNRKLDDLEKQYFENINEQNKLYDLERSKSISTEERDLRLKSLTEQEKDIMTEKNKLEGKDNSNLRLELKKIERKDFELESKSNQQLIQKLEEPKQELIEQVIQEPKQKQKQEGELIGLGTGLAQLVKTKQLIKPKQLEKPKYVLINQPKQKQKQEGILITVPKQGQKQSEKLDQLLKQKLQQDQTFKQQSDQLFKPIQMQALEQPQKFKQEEQNKLVQDLVLSPKTLQAQDQKLIQETIQTTKPKPKEPPIPPGLLFSPPSKNPKKKKLTKKEEEFIGNSSDVQIEGLYKRNETTLGVNTINKLVGKDYARGYKEYKNKIKDPFSRKNKKL